MNEENQLVITTENEDPIRKLAFELVTEHLASGGTYYQLETIIRREMYAIAMLLHAHRTVASKAIGVNRGTFRKWEHL